MTPERLTLLKDALHITIEDIIKYSKDYLDNGLLLGICAALFYLVAALLFRRRSEKPGFRFAAGLFFRSIILILLAIYGYAVAGITVLSRRPDSVFGMDLELFGTLTLSLSALVFWVENIIMLIPLGFLLPFLCRPMRRVYWCAAVGLLASLTIEITQYTLHRGRFQVDDLLTNLTGTVVGFLLYAIPAAFCRAVSRLFRKSAPPAENIS